MDESIVRTVITAAYLAGQAPLIESLEEREYVERRIVETCVKLILDIESETQEDK